MKKRLFDFIYRSAILLSGVLGVFLLFQEKSEIDTIGLFGYSWRKILLVSFIVIYSLLIVLMSFISKESNPKKFSLIIKIKSFFFDNPLGLKVLIYFLIISGVILFINLRFMALYPTNYISVLQMKIFGFYVFVLLINFILLIRLFVLKIPTEFSLKAKSGLLRCIFEYAILILIAAAIFSPIIYTEIFVHTIPESDFLPHTQWAQQLLEAPQQVPKGVIAHSAWQLAVVISHVLIGQSWSVDAFIVTLISILLTVIILYWLFRKKLAFLPAGVLSLGLSIVAPLAFFYPLDHWMYLGYIGITSYHNPTTLMLRPLAILQFYFAAKVIQGKSSNYKEIITTALISALAVFTKPNYAICLLPSMGILTLIRIWKKMSIDWKRLIIGIVLPTVLILIWQFSVTYGVDEESRTVFAPFGFMQYYSSYLLLKFLLSISFPLITTIIFWKQAIKNEIMQLGWIGFGTGSFLTYFFTENGPRFAHGNFAWSGIITLFILFVCCVYFLSEQELHKNKWYLKWPIISSGVLHVIFGIIFYCNILITKRFL